MSMLFVVSVLLGAAPQDVPQTLEKLTLRVAPAKPFFLELEPVTLRVRVENPTRGPVLVPPSLHAGPSLQVQIQGKDGSFETYHPAWMPFKEPPPAAPPGVGAVVRANYRAHWTETLYYKTRTPGKQPRRTFDSPGTYVLRVRIYLEDAEVVSNKVEVVIKKPADGVNEAAAEFLRAKDVDRFLGRDGRFYPGTEEGLQNLEAFLRSFPGCVYEPYALFGLGVHQFDLSTPALHPQKDYSTPGLRRATEILTRVSAVKDHPYAADAALLAARAYYHMGDVENAKKLLAPVQDGQALNHQEAAEALLRALEK